MSLSVLITRRNTVQRRLMRTTSQISKWDETKITVTEIKLVVTAAQEYSDNLNKVYEEISNAATSDEMKAEEATFDTLFESVRSMQVRAGELLIKKEAEIKNHASPSFKLERIKLPEFKGATCEWQSFHDLFKSSVDKNPALSGAEKLIHLKSCLVGEAAGIISSFQATDANYKEAWALVVKRYSNQRELIFAHIRRLDDMKSNNEETALGLRSITDTVNECVRSLTNLKVPVEHWDLIIIYHAQKKLSTETRKQWLIEDKDPVPTLTKFIEYIEARAQALADSDSQFKSKKTAAGNQKKSSSHVTTRCVCPMCSDNHHLYKCKKFQDSTTNDRREFVKGKQLCYNCLFPGHSAGKCRMEFTCRKCGKRHHSLLHPESEEPTCSSSAVGAVQEVQVPESQSTSSTHCTFQSENLVLMGTLMVSVEDSLGAKQKCRLFLDPGSESNFITQFCVDRLGLKRKKTCISVTGISGSAGETATGMVKLNLFSNVSDHRMTISSLILRKITNQLPREKCSGVWPHLQGLQLGDPSFNVPGHIDILLGAGDAASIMIEGIRHGPRGAPSAQNTKFGWILSGVVQSSHRSCNHIKVHSHHSNCNMNDVCLDSSLTKFWELEEPEGIDIPLSKEEEDCQSHFSSTHVRDAGGTYSVELPFKYGASPLGQSRDLALKRFYRLEKRLSQNPVIKQEYIRCMRESVNSNFMELVPVEEIQKCQEVYYMPHREVVKESSSSTKVRIVYDASAKSSNGESLNDVLMTGPKLQIDLVPLLIKFRSHQIAMSADIVKFYPQFKVNRKHVDYQRLVWREDSNLPIQDYRMLRVTFGVTSAPFLAIRCLQQLAEDESADFPRAAQVIRNEFLVDNLLSGSDNLESALSLQKELLQVMERGNLKLTKWSSNNFHTVEAVPPEQRELEFPLSIEEDEAIKTIGVLWNPSLDSFGVSISVPDISSPLSKRRILSSIAKTFDPLGWVSPVTIRAKILMQLLWKEKLDWDSPLPPPFQITWKNYCQELVHLKSFRIPRCIVGPSSSNSNSVYELHGFSDASQVAYAACVYLRTVGDTSDFVNLVISKTKVAPVKTETIPRLELCGAVLLSKLMNEVQNCLSIPFRVVRCWTDSTIVLDWLHSSGKLPIFVANRVRKIKAHISSSNWYHVSGTDNPADAASRGISAQNLIDSTLWLQGPSWLSTALFPETEALSHSAQTEQSSLSSLIEKSSSYSKLQRTVAFCNRFRTNCQLQKQDRVLGNISVDELQKATLTIVSCVQADSFQEEISRCKENLLIKSRVKYLTPFVDSFGHLRVGGRLAHSSLNSGQKHPLLLPQKHQFTEIVVRYFHLKYQHAGPQLLLSILREQFWIIRGPVVVKQIVRRCVICHRQTTATSEQVMGQLPSPRVNQARPFSKSGVDYAGPFTLCLVPGRNPKLIKHYVSVFVCMATRAVHLELVGDLSTPAFIGALTRFIARRGLPTDLYSDCGKNFVGASNEMKEFIKFMKSSPHQTQVHEFLSSQEVKCHFNPPSSPHHGGLWEAAVKSMKKHLKCVVGDRHLSVEEFGTLLHQVEACLNSRPITQISADPNDLSALTPGHFLMGTAPLALPQHDLSEVKQNRLSRWQAVQQMFQHFWRRWNTEYLQNLQSSPKWFHPKSNLEVGMLVLLRDDEPSLGPLRWKLGRILKVYPGADGRVRVCDIKTSSGPVYKRPVVKLSPLPIYN